MQSFCHNSGKDSSISCFQRGLFSNHDSHETFSEVKIINDSFASVRTGPTFYSKNETNLWRITDRILEKHRLWYFSRVSHNWNGNNCKGKLTREINHSATKTFQITVNVFQLKDFGSYIFFTSFLMLNISKLKLCDSLSNDKLCKAAIHLTNSTFRGFCPCSVA